MAMRPRHISASFSTPNAASTSTSTSSALAGVNLVTVYETLRDDARAKKKSTLEPLLTTLVGTLEQIASTTFESLSDNVHTRQLVRHLVALSELHRFAMDAYAVYKAKGESRAKWAKRIEPHLTAIDALQESINADFFKHHEATEEAFTPRSVDAQLTPLFHFADRAARLVSEADVALLYQQPGCGPILRGLAEEVFRLHRQGFGSAIGMLVVATRCGEAAVSFSRKCDHKALRSAVEPMLAATLGAARAGCMAILYESRSIDLLAVAREASIPARRIPSPLEDALGKRKENVFPPPSPMRSLSQRGSTSNVFTYDTPVATGVVPPPTSTAPGLVDRGVWVTRWMLPRSGGEEPMSMRIFVWLDRRDPVFGAALYWSATNNRVKVPHDCLPLKQMTDIFVGKHTDIFQQSDVGAGVCMSLIGGTEMELNMAFASAALRRQWTEGITRAIKECGKNTAAERVAPDATPRPSVSVPSPIGVPVPAAVARSPRSLAPTSILDGISLVPPKSHLPVVSGVDATPKQPPPRPASHTRTPSGHAPKVPSRHRKKASLQLTSAQLPPPPPPRA